MERERGTRRRWARRGTAVMLVGMRRKRLRSDPENRLAEGRVAQNVLWIDSKFLARVGYISMLVIVRDWLSFWWREELACCLAVTSLYSDTTQASNSERSANIGTGSSSPPTVRKCPPNPEYHTDTRHNTTRRHCRRPPLRVERRPRQRGHLTREKRVGIIIVSIVD
jgi:hypothetical protein